MNNRLLGLIAVAVVAMVTAGLLRIKDTATDFGNEGGTDALTGNAGGIF